MPLFHHEKDAPDEQPGLGPNDDPARWRTTLAHYEGLPFAQRAAELLAQIGPALDGGAGAAAQTLIDPLLPAIHDADLKISDEEWNAAVRLEVVLHDSLQTLVLGRLLMRREFPYKGATDISYRISPDGSAALTAGNAAEVLARRLPD